VVLSSKSIFCIGSHKKMDREFAGQTVWFGKINPP
jgi:hypothetical protein